MDIKNKHPKTLVDAIRYFSEPANSIAFFVQIRWPDGVVRCPHCGSEQVSFLAKYNRWECKNKHPRRQFTVKVGSVMEDSPLGLDKWAAAVWLEANAKNSISSYEIHRALGITQKSAWFMLHRIRLAIKQNSFEKMGGNGNIVEADETGIGGLAANMHKAERRKKLGGRRGSVHMASVMGLLERHSGKKHSTVRATVIPDRQKETLREVIHKNVEPGAQIFTDALMNYRGLSKNFDHQFIDHAETYVRGAVHTNGLENFWALFKRCIKGTHVSIDPFHLAAYVDSEAFRFNNRDLNDGQRFILAVGGMNGKRLTYKALTGQPEGCTANDKEEASEEKPN